MPIFSSVNRRLNFFFPLFGIIALGSSISTWNAELRTPYHEIWWIKTRLLMPAACTLWCNKQTLGRCWGFHYIKFRIAFPQFFFPSPNFFSFLLHLSLFNHMPMYVHTYIVVLMNNVRVLVLAALNPFRILRFLPPFFFLFFFFLLLLFILINFFSLPPENHRV